MKPKIDIPERCFSKTASQPRAKGFTLIEIMVVVIIIGVLAALVVPKIMSRPDEARAIAARQDIATILQALKLYRLDNIRYPSAEQGLMALVAKPAGEPVPALQGMARGQGMKGQTMKGYWLVLGEAITDPAMEGP